MDYSKIVSPKTYADDDALHEIFRHMRVNEPIALVESDTHDPFYAIAKHADVIGIARRNELFHNAPMPVLLSREIMQRESGGAAPALRTLIHMDEPDHRAFRDLTKDWFLPANLKKLDAAIAELAQDTVDRLLEFDDEFDFVQDAAVWFPLRVIMKILGVPESDQPLMLKLTQELFGSEDPDLQRNQPSAEERAATLTEFFTPQPPRRIRPRGAPLPG